MLRTRGCWVWCKYAAPPKWQKLLLNYLSSKNWESLKENYLKLQLHTCGQLFKFIHSGGPFHIAWWWQQKDQYNQKTRGRIILLESRKIVNKDELKVELSQRTVTLLKNTAFYLKKATTKMCILCSKRIKSKAILNLICHISEFDWLSLSSDALNVRCKRLLIIGMCCPCLICFFSVISVILSLTQPGGIFIHFYF